METMDTMMTPGRMKMEGQYMRMEGQYVWEAPVMN